MATKTLIHVMPNHLKLLISILALSVSPVMYFHDVSIGTSGAAKWMALFLGPFIIFAIWVFPETRSRAIQKETAKRRNSE